MDAVGSAIRVDTRGREVMRILPRVNENVNEEWISDKTRHIVDGLRTQRLDRPYVRDNGKLRAASWSEAFAAIAARVAGKDGKRIGAIAGILIAPVTFLHFTMMQHVLHFAFAAAVLGGIFSLPGSVLGGVVIGVTANLTGAYVSSAWKEVIPFVVMLAILVVRPHGLLARRHLKKV